MKAAKKLLLDSSSSCQAVLKRKNESRQYGEKARSHLASAKNFASRFHLVLRVA